MSGLDSIGVIDRSFARKFGESVAPNGGIVEGDRGDGFGGGVRGGEPSGSESSVGHGAHIAREVERVAVGDRPVEDLAPSGEIDFCFADGEFLIRNGDVLDEREDLEFGLGGALGFLGNFPRGDGGGEVC